MSFTFVDPTTYRKYRDQVIEMSQSIQVNYQEFLPPERRRPGYSDREIADKLGLDERTVVEIRCVAEREFYSIDEFEKALDFKDRACRGYAAQGLSFSTKRYLKNSKTK